MYRCVGTRGFVVVELDVLAPEVLSQIYSIVTFF